MNRLSPGTVHVYMGTVETMVRRRSRITSFLMAMDASESLAKGQRPKFLEIAPLRAAKTTQEESPQRSRDYYSRPGHGCVGVEPAGTSTWTSISGGRVFECNAREAARLEDRVEAACVPGETYPTSKQREGRGHARGVSQWLPGGNQLSPGTVEGELLLGSAYPGQAPVVVGTRRSIVEPGPELSPGTVENAASAKSRRPVRSNGEPLRRADPHAAPVDGMSIQASVGSGRTQCFRPRAAEPAPGITTLEVADGFRMSQPRR